MIDHELYRSINVEHQQKIEKTMRMIVLKKGDNLFLDGDEAKYIYYVASGNVKIFKTSYNGNETIFDIYDPSSQIY